MLSCKKYFTKDTGNINTLQTTNQNFTLCYRHISYTAFNKVSTIIDTIENNDTIRLNLHYGFDNQRRKTTLSKPGSGNKTKYFFGNYEIHTNDTGEKTFLFVNSPVGLCATIESYEENQVPVQKVWHSYTDHLGSLVYLENADNSSETLEYSYDCWGNPRKVSDWLDSNPIDELIADRGFTGHEHLTEFGLINMNGRVYDPKLGRFLSPDPFVQAPHSVGGFNRYTYCYNNPLKYTDPSGYVPGYHLSGFDWAYSYAYDRADPRKDNGGAGSGTPGWGGNYQGIWSKLGAGGNSNPGVSYEDWIFNNMEIVITTYTVNETEGNFISVGIATKSFNLTSNIQLLYNPTYGIYVQRDKTTGEYYQPYSNISLNPYSLLAEAMKEEQNRIDSENGGGGLINGAGFATSITAAGMKIKSFDTFNSGYWKGVNGKYYSQEVLRRMSNGKFTQGVQGYRNSAAIASRTANALKTTGTFLGAAGVVLVAAEGFVDGQFSMGDCATILASSVAFVPGFGWVYGALDFGVGMLTGTSISRRIGNVVDNPNSSLRLTIDNFLVW